MDHKLIPTVTSPEDRRQTLPTYKMTQVLVYRNIGPMIFISDQNQDYEINQTLAATYL